MTEDFISSLESAAPVSDELAEARALVAGLAVRVEADKKAAFAPDVIAALSFLKKQSRGDYVEALDILKSCGVGVAEVKSEVVKTSKLREVMPGEGARRVSVCDFTDLRDVPEQIRGLIVPSGYRILADEAGGYELVKSEMFSVKVVSHCAPFITGRTKDIDGLSEGLRLSFSRGNGFDHRVVNRETLMDSQQMRQIMGWYPATSNNAKLQVDYFAKAEAENLSNLPTIKTTSHLGWQGKGKRKDESFLIGTEIINKDGELMRSEGDLNSLQWPENAIVFRSGSPGADQIIDAFTRAGNFGDWVNAVQAVSKYPRVMIALYTSFAAPLLAIFDCPNFILDLCSRTSQGKTTTQRLAGSVWGSPDERKPSSVVQTWDQTKVSVERRLAILANLPLILDDTKRIKDVRQIPEILYTVASGQGRGRGTIQGIQTILNWSTLLISSGEQRLTSFSNDGGVKMRVMEIEGAPFGAQDTKTAKIVEALNLAICQNYGHAGPEFARWVIQNRAKWDEWKAAFRQKVQGYIERATNEKASRLALYAAIIAQAAELVHEALNLPWKYSDPLETLWAEISGDADDPLGCKKALRYLLEWADSNAARFVGREMDTRTAPSGGWIGKWERGDDSSMAIYPKHVEDILTEQKYHFESILNEWRERGWLETSGPTRFTKQVRIRNQESPIRMIVFTEKAMAEIREGS